MTLQRERIRIQEKEAMAMAEKRDRRTHRERKQRWRQTRRRKWETEKSAVVVHYILRLIVLAVLVRSILRSDFEGTFTCLLVLVVFALPTIIEERTRVEFPSLLEIIIMVHVFAAEILGELACYYVRFAYWDTLLHTVWGFLCAALGFSLVSILNSDEHIRFQLSPLYLALTAFCFSMTVGVLWEFVEFGIDRLFLTDMQKDTVLHTISSVALDPTNSNRSIAITGIESMALNGQDIGLGGYLDIGLYDTMEDLFVNFIGAVVFSVIGYFDAKHPGSGKLARKLIPYVRKGEGKTAPSDERSPC